RRSGPGAARRAAARPVRPAPVRPVRAGCRFVPGTGARRSTPSGRAAIAPAGRAATARSGRPPGVHAQLRQLDRRAVLPDPLERVVGALLGVLHVDHPVEVVKGPPAALPFALAADQAGARLGHPQLDLVDDGLALAVV